MESKARFFFVAQVFIVLPFLDDLHQSCWTSSWQIVAILIFMIWFMFFGMILDFGKNTFCSFTIFAAFLSWGRTFLMHTV